MATINLTTGTPSQSGVASLYGKPIAQLYKLINLVDVAALKGSALATGDVIETVSVPAYSTIITPRIRVLEGANVATLNIKAGYSTLSTADDITSYSFDITTIGLLPTPTLSTLSAWPPSSLYKDVSTYTKIAITLCTFSGTVPTTGVLAVSAVVVDMSKYAGSNIAGQNS